MARHSAGLLFELAAHDGASPAFLKVASAADKAAASTERAAATMGRAQKRMASTGAALTKRATLPILAIGAVAVSQAAKYQKSMTLIGTITDQTSRQMASTSKGLLTVAKSTGTSLDQLTAGLYTVEKGGLRGAKALATVKAAAQGAKAENVDLATATSALTSIMASYGSKLRNPVAAMNMIIKGSGLAKTTMQDFAGSLSNVVPLASSLGIGFDQVAGAIATMTQHGETAQRATDNLNNLITNLAGQNNVAAASMNQLGIHTIDLSKNLGKRGLVGSLNLVLAAIQRHKQGGAIVVDSFRKSATASASLRTELDAMPKALQAQSRAFDQGKVSFKDYNTYVKGLGGQAYQLGKNFIATEAQAQGFNKQLTSGNSNVRTLASTLQKSLGGVTGMRVALMLSGQSAGQFAHNARDVSLAAQHAGKDVLGWSKTQSTLSVQLDKDKAALQVAAVQLGTVLIPALTKVVGWVGRAADGFTHLSSGQKSMLLWSAGILAAIGPVLSIGSKLMLVGRKVSQFTVGVGNAVARFSGEMSGMSAGATRAMRGVTAAVGGAAIGSAIGTLTANSSGGAKALGALTSAASGAAIGFAAGGPLGAAVGAAGGLLSNLASSFFGASDATDKAKKAVQDYTQALLADNGVVAANVKAHAAKTLQDQGDFDAARKLGFSLSEVTKAALGNKSAINDIRGSYASYYKVYKQIGDAPKISVMTSLRQMFPKATNQQIAQAVDYYKAYAKLQNDIGASSGSLATARKGTNDLADATAGLSNKVLAANDKIKGLQQQANNLKQGRVPGFDVNTAAGKKRLAEIQNDINRTRQIAAPTINVRDNTKGTLATIAANLNALRSKTIDITTYTKNVVLPYVSGPHGTGSTDAGQSVVRPARGGRIVGPGTGTSDSIPAMVSNGEYVVRASQASKHLALLHAINNGVRGFARGGAVSDRDISRTQSWLHRVDSLPYVFGAAGPGAYDCSGLVGAAYEQLTGRGSGRLFSTSNEGGVLASLGFKRGSGGSRAAMVVGWEHDGHLEHTTGMVGGLKFEAYGSDGVPLADQIRVGGNARDPRTFPNVMYLPGGSGNVKPGGDPKGAAGGSSVPPIEHIGKNYDFGGTQYASLRAAQNARNRYIRSNSSARQQALSGRVSSAIGGVGQTSSPQFDVAQVGVRTVATQLHNAWTLLGKEIDAGLHKNVADKFRNQLQGLAKLANRQMDALAHRIRTSDLVGLRRASHGTPGDVNTAVATLAADMRHLGVNTRTLNALFADQRKLIADQNRLSRDRNKLAAMQTYRSGVRSTLAGAFDSTKYGSVEDLLNGLSGATSANNRYSAQVNKLRREAKGNKTLLGYINQLAAQGETTTLDTLSHASGRQLGQVSKALGLYGGSLTAGSDAATLSRFGTTVAKQAAQVAADSKHIRDLVRTIDRLVEHNSKPVHIHLDLDGKEFKHIVVRETDHRIDHALKQLTDHHQYKR